MGWLRSHAGARAGIARRGIGVLVGDGIQASCFSTRVRFNRASKALPNENLGSLLLPVASSLMVAWPHPHMAAIWAWLSPSPCSSAMIDFQSIGREYRNPDVLASGFPIVARTSLVKMREANRSEFGQRLHSRRIQQRMTQVKLAEISVIAQSTIAEMERTGQGSAATPMLARALNCSAYWLATGEGPEEDLTTWPLHPQLLAPVRDLDADGRHRLGNVICAHLGIASLGEQPRERSDRNGTRG